VALLAAVDSAVSCLWVLSVTNQLHAFQFQTWLGMLLLSNNNR
jgi:hypothetical protein